MSLFVPETFVAHSGGTLHWKIECEALTDADWRCLALMAASMLPPFNRVVGIPRGGVPFADALRSHVTPGAHAWVLADDVWTTGGSMREALEALRHPHVPEDEIDWPVGVVAFSRSPDPLPIWCRAVLSVDPRVAA